MRRLRQKPMIYSKDWSQSTMMMITIKGYDYRNDLITICTNDNDWQSDNDNETLETKADDIFQRWVAEHNDENHKRI